SVPILGWSIRAAGFVPVDRGDRTASLATVEAALARLKRGRSLVVFPEETRTRTGELLPFKKGAALLALKSQLPLQPVGIAGTRQILPRGSWNMTPGNVVVAVGSPFELGNRTAKERGEVTKLVKENVAQLREEAAKELERIG